GFGLRHLEDDLVVDRGLGTERFENDVLVIVFEPFLQPSVRRNQQDARPIDGAAGKWAQPHIEIVRLDATSQGREGAFPDIVVVFSHPSSSSTKTNPPTGYPQVWITWAVSITQRAKCSALSSVYGKGFSEIRNRRGPLSP